MLSVTLLWGCGGKNELEHATSVLVGTVYVIGNEPFTNLAIQTEGRGTRIIRKDTTELYRSLWKMQGQKVRIHFRQPKVSVDSTQIILEQIEPFGD